MEFSVVPVVRTVGSGWGKGSNVGEGTFDFGLTDRTKRLKLVRSVYSSQDCGLSHGLATRTTVRKESLSDVAPSSTAQLFGMPSTFIAEAGNPLLTSASFMSFATFLLAVEMCAKAAPNFCVPGAAVHLMFRWLYESNQTVSTTTQVRGSVGSGGRCSPPSLSEPPFPLSLTLLRPRS